MRLPKLRYALPAGLLLLALGGAGVWLAKTTSSTPVQVPIGTTLEVRIDRTLASNQASPGDPFKATVAEPVEVNGKAVIPEGAEVQGVVVSAKRSGRLKGVAHLRLALESVEVDGKSYELHTSTVPRYGGNHRKNNWEFIGGGAGSGALIGALAAGGKGALIGGPVGAGAGLAVAAMTGKKDIRIPAETVLAFELARPLVVEVKG